MTSENRITTGLIYDITDALERHGYYRGDDQHADRAIGLMADLALDEPPVNPVLSQVRDVGVPHRMNDQGLRQAQGVAVGDEPGVYLGGLDPPAAFGHPQRRMPGAAEPEPDVLHVIGHGVYRPGHHRRDVTAPRRLTALGLAIAHVEHAVPAELRRGRVAAEVD